LFNHYGGLLLVTQQSLLCCSESLIPLWCNQPSCRHTHSHTTGGQHICAQRTKVQPGWLWKHNLPKFSRQVCV